MNALRTKRESTLKKIKELQQNLNQLDRQLLLDAIEKNVGRTFQINFTAEILKVKDGKVGVRVKNELFTVPASAIDISADDEIPF